MNKRINKTPDVADFKSSIDLHFPVIKHKFTQGKRHEQDWWFSYTDTERL